jgi:Tfp pilus assembly protein PilN
MKRSAKTRSFEPGMARVNLLPEALRLRHVVRRRVRGWSISVFAMAVLFGLGWHIVNSEARELRDIRALLREERAGIRREQQRTSQIVKRAEDLRFQEQILQALRRKQSASVKLALVASSLPDNALLRHIEFAVVSDAAKPNTPAPIGGKPGKPALPAPPPPRELRVEGFAADYEVLAGFLRKLKSSLADEVQLVKSNAEPLGKSTGFEFGIACRSRK